MVRNIPGDKAYQSHRDVTSDIGCQCTAQPRTHRDGIRAERTLANVCVQSQHGTVEKAESPERDSSCSELHSIISGAFKSWSRAVWGKVLLLKEKTCQERQRS